MLTITTSSRLLLSALLGLVVVSPVVAEIPPEMVSTPLRRRALGDFLARSFRDAVARIARGGRGIGKSGLVAVAAGGQEVLERNAVVFGGGTLQCRFVLGLPARGRTILGGQAEEMLLGEVPRIVEEGLRLGRAGAAAAEAHIAAVEDQDALRSSLEGAGLAAFVLVASLSSFFFPTRYSLDSDGVRVINFIYRRKRSWTEFRDLRRQEGRVKLLTLPYDSRLDNYRGMLLILPEDSEPVLAFLRARIREAHGDPA